MALQVSSFLGQSREGIRGKIEQPGADWSRTYRTELRTGLKPKKLKRLLGEFTLRLAERPSLGWL